MKRSSTRGRRGFLIHLLGFLAACPAAASAPTGAERTAVLKRETLAALGRHLQSARLAGEALLCPGAGSGEVLAAVKAAARVPVQSAALYSPDGTLLLADPPLAGGAPPWAGEPLFADPKKAWLSGRTPGVGLSTNTASATAWADLRLPLQCEEAAGFPTRAWAVLRVDVAHLLEVAFPAGLLESGESLLLAEPSGRRLFHHGPPGVPDLRLTTTWQAAGPRSRETLTRMAEAPAGSLVTDGFDPAAFAFLRFEAGWDTFTLGDRPVWLVREVPAGSFTPPADARPGLWGSEQGGQMALLQNGSVCEVYLRRTEAGSTVYADGRLLGDTFSASDRTRTLHLEGRFAGDGTLNLSVFSDRAAEGVRRETIRWRKTAPAAPSAPPADLPRMRI
ncbi:MAG: hypothetical protein U1F77_09635 [Kiritimatiellia bacterium]